MAIMDDNIESSEDRIIHQQTNINTKRKSILRIRKAGKNLVPTPMRFIALYVFLFV